MNNLTKKLVRAALMAALRSPHVADLKDIWAMVKREHSPEMQQAAERLYKRVVDTLDTGETARDDFELAYCVAMRWMENAGLIKPHEVIPFAGRVIRLKRPPLKKRPPSAKSG